MDLILRTSVIFGSAFIVAALLRRATPASRHFLWHVTMLLVATAPMLQPLMPRIALPTPIATAATAVPSSVRELWPAIGENRSSNAEPARSVASTPNEKLPSLSGVWLAGSLITATWFAIGYVIALYRARATRPTPGAVHLAAQAVARELGMRSAPEIRVTDRVHGPLTIGVFRPRVVLPAAALQWSSERQRAVLAHEMAHVRRADTRTQALVHIACALYWFNPLAWMAARALRRERERACDDAVIAMGVRPSSYAQDLLEIARVMSRSLMPTAGVAMARQSELEGRLLSLLTEQRARRPARFTRWAVSTAMAACGLVALGAHASAVERSAPVPTAGPPMPSLHFEEQSGAQQQRSERALIESLAAALEDDNQDVREKAAIGLALRSSPEVVEPLLRALRNPDAQVREKAAAGLSLRRDPRVVDALLVAITDVDAQVREKAAMALGTSGDPRAIVALKAATRDPDQQVREKAAMGMVLLTSSPLGPIDRREVESGLSWMVNTILRAIQ